MPQTPPPRRRPPKSAASRKQAPKTKPGRKRRRRLGRRTRILLSVPFFLLALLAAIVTAWDTVIFQFLAGASIAAGMFSDSGGDSIRLRLGGLMLFLVEFAITMGLFYLAECVRHGRLVRPNEAFTFGDDQ
jgi:hypothetical protein